MERASTVLQPARCLAAQARAPETHGFDDARDSFVLARRGAATRGDPLSIRYAGVPNARLLLLYGFASDDAAHHSRELYAGLSPSAPLFAEKSAALKKLGLEAQATGTKPFLLSADDPLPEDLLATLRAHRASQNDLDKAASDGGRAPLSPENERNALADLVAACDTMLKDYKATEDEDLKALADASLASPRLKLAIQVRLPERRALARCARAAKDKLAALSS